MGLVIGLASAIIVFILLAIIGGLVMACIAWIVLAILAIVFFGFMLKWIIIFALIFGIYKLLKAMFAR